jgi:1-phosphofructokinase family hexose kinase
MIITVTPNPALDRTLRVPGIIFDEMVRATDSQLDLDGKGVNVSKALAALGEATLIMGFAGGSAGETLARGLAAQGYTTDFTAVAGETRTNTMIIDAASNRYVKANEPGPTVGPADVAALTAMVQARLKPGDSWILSGSLPPGAPADLYARLLDILQAGGARGLLDTSGEPLRLGCQARPFLVKPNALEAQELTGLSVEGEGGALRAARAILASGVELVALSLGADGLLLASQDTALHARPPRVQALNPVGAGDALLAGIAWALEHGLELAELARWGVASGTAAAMHSGTGPPERTAVEALVAQVRLEHLTP